MLLVLPSWFFQYISLQLQQKKEGRSQTKTPVGTVWRAQVRVGLSLGEARVLSGSRVFGKQSAGCKRVFLLGPERVPATCFILYTGALQ